MQGTNSACKEPSPSVLSPCGFSHQVVGSIGWEGSVGGKEETLGERYGHRYGSNLSNSPKAFPVVSGQKQVEENRLVYAEIVNKKLD